MSGNLTAVWKILGNLPKSGKCQQIVRENCLVLACGCGAVLSSIVVTQYARRGECCEKSGNCHEFHSDWRVVTLSTQQVENWSDRVLFSHFLGQPGVRSSSGQAVG